MASLLAEVKNYQFLAENHGLYSQAFWPKLRSLFADFLLHAGRCFEVEVFTILLLWRYVFHGVIFGQSKLCVSGRTAWTIMRRFGWKPKAGNQRLYNLIIVQDFIFGL